MAWVKNTFERWMEHAVSRQIAWDEVYASPPYADIFAVVAGTFGAQYAFAGNVMWGPSYDWLRPFFIPLGIMLLVAAFGIGFRRALPEILHRLGWYLFGWYWILWGVGATIGNPGHITAWGTIILSCLCWTNANMEYQRHITLLREALRAELGGTAYKQTTTDTG